MVARYLTVWYEREEERDGPLYRVLISFNGRDKGGRTICTTHEEGYAEALVEAMNLYGIKYIDKM